MRKMTKSAFTLVELIVVITILAILGTIAFVSFQGYTKDAKNSKVTSDVGQILNKISADTAAGKTTLSDIVTLNGNNYMVAGNVNSGSTLPTDNGQTTASGTTYAAGEINYASLGMKADDFKFLDKDGNKQPYKVAYVVDKNFVTYEVAGNILDAAGNPKVVLKGTYYEVITSDVDGLIGAKTDPTKVATNDSNVQLY